MTRTRFSGTARLACVVGLVWLAGCSTQPPPALRPQPPRVVAKMSDAVRFAVFNTALSRGGEGDLGRALATPGDPAVARVAEVLQWGRPDVVLLAEFDFDATGRAADDFRRNYLAVPQNGAPPIDYPYAFAPRVNTGEPSGVDLDGDGTVGGPADAHGWGNYPGHYGMLVLSRYPLTVEEARSFRLLRWADFPENVIPPDHFSDDALAALRLSSKTHLDLPVKIHFPRGEKFDAVSVHLLLSHPTPPVFDGPEDRNGRRNHDEVRFWVDYLGGAAFTDDAGVSAALPDDASFVVLGDLNADPFDGDSYADAVNRLVGHHRLNRRITPASDGALRAAEADGGINPDHRGYPGHDTADFGDRPPNGPGNLRVDYALPSRDLTVRAAGVLWPTPDSPLSHLARASDHRLVWVDVSRSQRP